MARNYSEEAESYRGKSFSDLCSFYDIVVGRLTEHDRKIIIDDGYDIDDDMTVVNVQEETYLKLEKEYPDAMFNWDADDFEFICNAVLKPSNYGYIAFNTGIDWRGRSGYRISDTVKNVLARDYDVTQTICCATKGGKALLITESSHDVPMGAYEYIIALNKTEKELSDNGNFKFTEKYIAILDNIEYQLNQKGKTKA